MWILFFSLKFDLFVLEINKQMACETGGQARVMALKKIFLFILFLGKSLSASVGEFLKKLSVTCCVGQWSCR